MRFNVPLVPLRVDVGMVIFITGGVLGVTAGILTGATGPGLPLEGQQWWVAPVVGGIAAIATFLKKQSGAE